MRARPRRRADWRCEEFEARVETAVKSKNSYINNRDIAELLKGHVDSAVQVAVSDKQTDAEEASSWGERVTEKLQQIIYKPRIKRQNKS